jgi:small subunit ribosomal protein S1
MSDTEKPQTRDEPKPEAEQQPAPPPDDKPDRAKLFREKAADRQRQATAPPPKKVPSLQHEQSYGFGKKIDAFDAEMERELQEAMGDFESQALITEGPPQAKRGKAGAAEGPKKGRVFRIHGPDVFIDLPGGRSQGVLPLMQFPEGLPKLGQEVDVTIEGFDNANGLILLSRKGAAVTAEWSSIAEGMIVEARVTETNKGGLAVDVNGIRGFMPISQIDLYRVEDVEQFVNQRLRCLITEVDPEEHNLVVSRRALLEKEREENREKLWAQLAEGQVYEGIVRSLKDFGAFVDIGGVDGLLHVSEMSWQRVADPSKFVQPGQKVKVVVLKIDPERRKISFGMKQLTESPWDSAAEKYPHGKIVNGKVTRVMDFGAFVELEPALEGLIHISELSPARVRRVIDVVKVGQDVQVMVLNVDNEQRRISLSLKAALPQEPESGSEEAEEEVEEVKPQRPRTTPLRGGIGDKPQTIVKDEEE